MRMRLLMRLLLAAGADPRARNAQGLDAAERAGADKAAAAKRDEGGAGDEARDEGSAAVVVQAEAQPLEPPVDRIHAIHRRVPAPGVADELVDRLGGHR